MSDPYAVELTPAAQKDLKALPGHVRPQALALLTGLASEPRPKRAKELRGKSDIYRIWLAGQWRIAYLIDDSERYVLVLRIQRKGDIEYEAL